MPLYNKPVTTYDQQLDQLQERGLDLGDRAEAKEHLSHIGYYRLAGYWWPMLADKVNHTFKPGSRFTDVLALYNFDKQLRILIFRAIERIEISLRAKMIYQLSHEFDPWWFSKTELFIDSSELIKTLCVIDEEIDRSKETFIKEHKRKYKEDLRFPPCWKTLELTSFGNLSKLYGNLKNTLTSKDQIALDFGTVNHTFLPSWLQAINQIRNLCAHHCRVWNRNLPGRPKLMPYPPKSWVSTAFQERDMSMLYVHLCCIKYLLNAINPKNEFTKAFENLLNQYRGNIDHSALGLKAGWNTEPLWKSL